MNYVPRGDDGIEGKRTGIMDPCFGHIVNHDFASYHIAANADVGDIEAAWLDDRRNSRFT
jgi:hypothetical protein